jgi:hypothetical protein
MSKVLQHHGMCFTFKKGDETWSWRRPTKLAESVEKWWKEDVLSVKSADGHFFHNPGGVRPHESMQFDQMLRYSDDIDVPVFLELLAEMSKDRGAANTHIYLGAPYGTKPEQNVFMNTMFGDLPQWTDYFLRAHLMFLASKTSISVDTVAARIPYGHQVHLQMINMATTVMRYGGEVCTENAPHTDKPHWGTDPRFGTVQNHHQFDREMRMMEQGKHTWMMHPDLWRGPKYILVVKKPKEHEDWGWESEELARYHAEKTKGYLSRGFNVIANVHRFERFGLSYRPNTNVASAAPKLAGKPTRITNPRIR